MSSTCRGRRRCTTEGKDPSPIRHCAGRGRGPAAAAAIAATGVEHLEVLQAKLNKYLAFIESGEILTAYPKAAHRSIRIDVVLRCPPSPDATHFLEHACAVIRAAGFDLTWRVFTGPGVQES